MNRKSIAFGPVPSRRLGASLGINNIPPKSCSYNCVYCQLGQTANNEVIRSSFYDVDKITCDVKDKINSVKKKGGKIDFLCFVPDGEPTLDNNLGDEIRSLKPLGLKIAVISNSSLLWKKDVRESIMEADWVSLKIDAFTTKVWSKINRPHSFLRLLKILDGISTFADAFEGFLVTETMLINKVNDGKEEIKKIADFIKELDVEKSYISVPTRPPCEHWVRSPTEEVLNRAYHSFQENNIDVEYLLGYAENKFEMTDNAEEDLLNITSVHPMRKSKVKQFLDEAQEDWGIIKKLLKEGKIVEIEYNGEKFYMRNLRRNKSCR